MLTGLNTLIQRGDRVGIVGKNGAGKTTLINLILGKLTPSTGTVKLGSKLETAYSDQLRANLNPDQNLIDNICGGQEFIEIGGKSGMRSAISVIFCFRPIVSALLLRHCRVVSGTGPFWRNCLHSLRTCWYRRTHQ